uniref:Nuclear protein DGCR14 n=1 Tax=Elaeophora elaphi TaxID=1147741 RepID=A0A0R3RFA0_9BILA
MITPESGTPTSFDDADRAVSVPAQKLQNSKIVVLGAKKLETGKEVRVVLPEDKYLGRLQEIIARDYFPELPKLKAQKEYLDALAANDLTKIRELQLRYSTKRTIRRTSPTTAVNSPGVFDPNTPEPSSSYIESRVGKSEEGRSTKRKRPDENLTVDAYLNKFTSEDNASFEELALLHKKKEQIRNAWMYEAEKKHNEEFVTRGNELVRAADEQIMISLAPGTAEEKPKELDNWSYKARNIVHFHPEEAPLTLDEHLQRQKANQRIINKSATRFSEEVNKEKRQITTVKGGLQQAAANAGKVDITGREAGFSKADGIDLIATPSPAPGVDESPFMTWGEIEGTPFRLDASDMATPTSAPAFKIPEIPVREKIAQSIAETIAKRYHDKRKVAMRQVEKHHAKTPSFGSIRTSEKLATMSPAARRLAAHGLGIRLSSDRESKINFNYTPSRSRTSHSTCSTGTPGSSQLSRKTPKRSIEGVITHADINSSITDNLLSFGQSNTTAVKKMRPSAADFF